MKSHQPWLTLAVLLTSNSAFALDFGIPMMGSASGQKTLLRYSGSFDRSLRTTDLSGSVPVYRGEKDSIALSAHANQIDVYSNSTPVKDLYDLGMGVTFTHNFDPERQGSISGTFGSASDKPFADSTVDTVSATALYSFSDGPTSRWLLLLNYSNNRPILNNIPLPGFAYSYFPSKTFRATFGIPFASISWGFADRWNLTLFTVVPWIAKVQLAHTISGPLQGFTGVDFSQRTYLEYRRVDPKDRFFYDEKKVFIGLRSPLSRSLFGELETGTSFGRRFFSARNYTRKPAQPVELGSSGYVKLGLTATF